MGYDMYIVAEDAAEERAYKAADAMVKIACEKRDGHERGSAESRAVQDAIDAMADARYRMPSKYFRLNVWGMSRCGEAMYGLGMLDTATESLKWPERADFGVDDETWENWDWQQPAEDAPEPLRRFYQTQQAALSHRPEKPTGICDFKFSSNDGWIVTPEELGAALATYDERTGGGAAAPDFEWWADWIDYLRRARARGGFSVH
jgi:hypothetical protein